MSRKASVSVLGLVRAPLDLFRIREGGRSLNPWKLMNHHLFTLHMTRSIRLDGPALIEVAYSPSSEGARAGLFS